MLTKLINNSISIKTLAGELPWLAYCSMHFLTRNIRVCGSRCVAVRGDPYDAMAVTPEKRLASTPLGVERGVCVPSEFWHLNCHIWFMASNSSIKCSPMPLLHGFSCRFACQRLPMQSFLLCAPHVCVCLCGRHYPRILTTSHPHSLTSMCPRIPVYLWNSAHNHSDKPKHGRRRTFIFRALCDFLTSGWQCDLCANLCNYV